MNMDSYDFSATQVCDDYLEPTQSIGGTQKASDRKQVGILIVNNKEYPIYTGSIRIGRHASNSIILKDSTVSKYHAEIEGHRETSFIVDLKSCNGTLRNKQKLVPNKSYELADGVSLRFGSVTATFRKLSSLDSSILKTPSVVRSGEIIASTPDSILNATDDDSSVVYGTQKNQGSSEFRRPSLPPKRLETNRRNLNQEFFDDSLLNSETGSTSIHEQETQATLLPKKDDSSGIHDLETQKFSFTKPETSNQSIQKSSENSQAICEVDTQVVPLNLNKAGTSDTDEEGNFQKTDKEELLTASTQKCSAKIHEASTQAFPVKSTLRSKNSNVDDSSGIHDLKTQVFFNKPGTSKLSLQNSSGYSEAICEAETQAVPLDLDKANISDTDEEGNFQKTDKEEELITASTQKYTPAKIHEASTQAIPVKSTLKIRNSNPDDSETDDEGIFNVSTQKVSASSDQIHEEATQAFALPVVQSKKLNKSGSRIDTEEEGSFKGPTQKVPTKSKNIHEESNQALGIKSLIKAGNSVKDSRNQDSDTDEEGYFQEGIFSGPTQRYTASSPKKIHEEATQAIVPKKMSPTLRSKISAKTDSHIVPDSDTDEEGIFEDETQKISPKSREKIHEAATQGLSLTKSISKLNLKSKSTISAKADSNFADDSETDEEGDFQGPTQKYSPKSTEKIHEAATQSVNTEVKESNSKRKTSIAKKADSSVADDSETDDEGIFTSPSSKVSSKSDTVQAKVETPASKSDSKSVCESDSKSNFESKSASEDCISESNSNSESKISAKLDSKTLEDSDTKVEAILKKKEDSNVSEVLEQKRFGKRSIQKLQSSPQPSTSGQYDSETDDEGTFNKEEDFNSRKEKGQEKIAKPATNGQTDSEADDESNFNKKKDSNSRKVKKQEKILKSSIQKPKMSAKLSTSGQNDSETDEEQIFEPKAKKSFTKSSPAANQNGKQESQIDDLGPTQILPIPSSSPRESLYSRNASIEDFDYEMAPTQLLEEFETRKMKTPETKTNSRGKRNSECATSSRNKTNSGKKGCGKRSSNKRSIAKIDDTIEENLNQMFEGEAAEEEIEEPAHMLTQQLENILEASQVVNEELTQMPSTSTRSASRKIETSSLTKSPSLSERSLRSQKSPQVEADNCSPRMSKLNIIKSKKVTAEKIVETPVEKKPQEQKTEDKKAPMKKRPLGKEEKVEDKKAPLKKGLGKDEKAEDKNAPLKKRPLSKDEKAEDKKTPLKKRLLRSNDEEPETSNTSRAKRLKVTEAEELEIKTLFARRSLPFQDSPNRDAKPEASVEEPEKKNILGKLKIVSKTAPKGNKQPGINSCTSSTNNDSTEEPKPKGRGRKAQKKVNDEPKVESSENRRVSKRTASSSLVEDSAVPDSREVSTSTTGNLKVPSKPKKARYQKATATENDNNVNGNEVEASKSRRTSKRQGNQSKTIISNTSSSSSVVESSFNGATTSTTEKSKKTVPKKTATRGRKKKEVNDTESARADNLSASSSMLSLTEASVNGSSSAASTPSRSKRSRASSPLKHKVLFTKVPVKDYQKSLSKLGLSDTEDINKCTVLVTDKVRRTLKFLCATSQGIPIVSINWLTDSAQKMSLQDLDQYIVKDPAAEVKFGFNLSESLKKAREKKMLAGYTVLLTPNITAPPVAELKGMVVASGGKAILRPPPKWSENTVVVSDENDLENAKKFMAKAPKAVTLHSTEFLLTGILKQEVDLRSYLLKNK